MRCSLWLLLWPLDSCEGRARSIFETCILVPEVLTLTEAQLIQLARKSSVFVLQNGKWLGQGMYISGFAVVLSVTRDLCCPQPLSATQKPGEDLLLFEHQPVFGTFPGR